MSFDRTRLPDTLAYFQSEGLKLTPRGKWRTAPCEFHGGSDSLRIRVDTGAWVCMSCGAKGGDVIAYHMAAHGLDFVTAAKALDCWVEDGKPHQHHRPKPLPAADALAALAHETMLIAIVASDMCRGIPIDEETKDRVLQAVGRINLIQGAYQ